MRKLLLLLLISTVSLAAYSHQNPSTPHDTSLAVLEFKWSKKRQPVEKLPPGISQPAAMTNPTTRNYERNTRINQPRGERDPTADTLEARSAELDKVVQESRAPKPIDGFAYKVKVQNLDTKVADVVFLEYQFIDPAKPDLIARRQFLCAVKIEPGKTKEIQAFSVSGRGDVVNLAGASIASGNSLTEKVVVNRVEYVDGTIWRRKDWNYGEIRESYLRAVAAPWGKEMCRSL